MSWLGFVSDGERGVGQQLDQVRVEKARGKMEWWQRFEMRGVREGGHIG
jgi:hypothetical protein